MNITGSAISLCGLPLFSVLSDAEADAIQPLTQLRNYLTGAEIVKRGENADGVYLLLAGQVNVLVEDARGHKVIVDTLREKDTFNELALFCGKPSELTFTAARPSQILYVPREALVDALEQNCALASFVATTLAKRLEHAYRKLETLAHDDVYARVLDVLLAHGHDEKGEWHADVGAEATSTMVGASREMVSRVTKDLVQRGLLLRRKRRLVAADREALHQWALQRRSSPPKRRGKAIEAPGLAAPAAAAEPRPAAQPAPAPLYARVS